MLFRQEKWFIWHHFNQLLSRELSCFTFYDISMKICVWVSLSDQSILYGFLQYFHCFCRCTFLLIFLMTRYFFLFAMFFLRFNFFLKKNFLLTFFILNHHPLFIINFIKRFIILFLLFFLLLTHFLITFLIDIYYIRFIITILSFHILNLFIIICINLLTRIFIITFKFVLSYFFWPFLTLFLWYFRFIYFSWLIGLWCNLNRRWLNKVIFLQIWVFLLKAPLKVSWLKQFYLLTQLTNLNLFLLQLLFKKQNFLFLAF